MRHRDPIHNRVLSKGEKRLRRITIEVVYRKYCIDNLFMIKLKPKRRLTARAARNMYNFISFVFSGSVLFGSSFASPFQWNYLL